MLQRRTATSTTIEVSINMLSRIIEFSIKKRFIVLAAALVVFLWGLYTLSRTPLDAIPDLSDVQVIVYAEYKGQAPEVIEDQVTYPLTSALVNVPGAKVVRGYSFFGSSIIYVIFEDKTDMYWARSRVLEYLNFAGKNLPPSVVPALGPDATGVGWVYEYALVDKTGAHDLAELRSLQDWVLRYELQGVAGVAEVASVGGFVKQYQITIDPTRLLAYDVTLSKIKEAVMRSNNDVGASVVEMAESEFMVRGRGYIKGVEDIKNIPVAVDKKGTPVMLRDVADVGIGPEMRRGVIELGGEGEAVGAIVVMRYGENAREVIGNVKKKIEDLRKNLPAGVELVTVYDRSGVIDRAVSNLALKLVEESALVALICAVFLMHFRSALVAIATIPLGVLAAFIVMYYQGISANIMSLGGIAIAIGAMIDAAIVMVENAHKHIERDKAEGRRWQLVFESAKEVGPALFFSLLIITVSFVPIFSLEGEEGKLFSPLAYTKTYTMAAAAALAVTLVPVLTGFFIRGEVRAEHDNPVSRFFQRVYMPVLDRALRARKAVIAAAVIMVAVTVVPLMRLGSEFMPSLDEGDFLYMPTTLPGISIAKSKEILQQTDKIIMTFPEVERVFGKIGRAETATDPAPLSMIETIVKLKPRSEWREGMTTEKLKAEMQRALKLPGISNAAMTMPIETRIDMLSTGIRSPIGIKIAGDDLQVLERVAADAERILGKMPETSSVFAERVVGGSYLDFEIDRVAAARYGLTVGDVEDVIESAVGGMNVTYTIEGRERYPVNIRYGREMRDDIAKLKRVLVPTPRGEHIPIAQLADIKVKKGPAEIKSENARLNAWVYIYPEGSLGSYVGKARKLLGEELDVPPGYTVEWSGRYEYMQRAAKRLMAIVPAVTVIIFLLLYGNFRNVVESLIVMASLPFALAGGVWFMFVLGYDLSVATAAGFIALGGVAAETGVIMLVYLDMAWKRRLEGGVVTPSELEGAIKEGACQRLRPKLMTVSAIIAGLLPIMWGSGTGSDVMKRIAAPMVGGMISATVLTLVVIPVIYSLWKGRVVKEP